MCDAELYQKLLGFTAPWQVMAVAVQEASSNIPPKRATRPRRWRHLNTMQWKTFIEADVPWVDCLKCGIKQIPVAWAENGSRLLSLFEAYAIQVLQVVQSPVQAQWLTALSWDQVERVMGRAAHNVERAVARGVARRSLEGLRLLCTQGDAGLDEKGFGKVSML